MIIELIGPGAVGKSTVGPLLAQRVGMPHFAGQGYYRLDGTPMTRAAVWIDRVASVATRPGLFRVAMGMPLETVRDRLSFALTTCRRERFARSVVAEGGGVLSSGSVHWLCQESTRYDAELDPMLPLVVLADVYVRLSAGADVVTARLSARGGKSEERIAEHHLWVERYEQNAERLLAMVDRPVVPVLAESRAEDVADEIASRLVAQGLIAPPPQ